MEQKIKASSANEHASPAQGHREMVTRLLSMPGSQVLNTILDHENPGELIENMSKVDLYWMVKKIGEDDSLPLLRLATNEQWQYILDMELWQRDRIILDETVLWLDRLYEADPSRLARWLFSEEGDMLASLFFYGKIQVMMKDESEEETIPKGFSTFDGIFYFRILDQEHEAFIQRLLKSMANEDYDRYHSLLLGLAGVLPAELEEDMYRLKGVRLAEEGYLPFEEAVSVYSYQKAELLKKDRSEYFLFRPEDEEERDLVPVTPLIHAPGNNLLAKTMEGIKDDLLLDRIRLEFAGLCNQIFSADGVRFEGLDTLKRICRKAGGYINIGLEILSEGDVEISRQFLGNHPLISIFRVGFGRALELKWDVQRWLKKSWFLSRGFEFDFWGDVWGGVLTGLVKDRPLFAGGVGEENDYRDFERVSELEDCRVILNRVVLLDRLLERMSSGYPFDRNKIKDPLVSFYPLLFDFWARVRLGLEPCFAPLSLKQAKDFFRWVRKGKQGPPYELSESKEIFIQDLTSMEIELGPGDMITLKETLSMLWQEFKEEYARVRVGDLDPRYTKFLFISSRPGTCEDG